MEFNYKAVTFDGKYQHGSMTGESEQKVVAQLQRQGLIPVQISPSGSGGVGLSKKTVSYTPEDQFSKSFKKYLSELFTGKTRLKFSSKPKNKDLIMFAEHLSIMLKSGITLNKSLSLLGELSENKNFSRVINEVHEQIREGSPLWQALQNHSSTFPQVFINMVRAGEAGGVLDTVLSRIAEYLDEIQELKEYIVSALIYPTILGITAIGSILVMLTFVMPRFSQIFKGMGVELPFVTQLMLGTGNFLQSYWWILVLIICAIFIGIKYIIQTPPGKKKWDALKLNMPIWGKIFQKIEISRFSRTLGTLLDSGVSILSAMNIVKGVILNSILREALEEVYNDLKQGKMLSLSLNKRKVFPSLAVNILGVGEESGNLPAMLNKISDIYEKDLKSAIKSFTSIFEPAVILVMGLVIGIMVISMLVAIFSINQIGM